MVKNVIGMNPNAKSAEDKDAKFRFETDFTVESDHYLRLNPISLFATNIRSYMGGKYNPWADAFKKETYAGGRKASIVP